MLRSGDDKVAAAINMLSSHISVIIKDKCTRHFNIHIQVNITNKTKQVQQFVNCSFRVAHSLCKRSG